MIATSAQQDSTTQARLRSLARQLQLPVCDLSTPGSCSTFHFYLSLFSVSPQDNTKTLGLASTADDFKGNVHIDFVHGKLGHRRQFGGGRGQALAKAIGMKHGNNPTIVDATAGLGRDAFILASLGAHVTMIERSPILAALLEDGLQRLAAEPELSTIAEQQLRLVRANAIEWLQQHAKENTVNRPEVVYLDPMYPHRSKSALVKKEMRALRALVGDDDDAGLLLQAARQCALKRVVVKRPKGAPPVGDSKPSGNVQSKNTRYDIYPVSKAREHN
ncbi:MAG: class I SAM-dependent methyltransferase [Gammaproteobacteria bacterium]|nr:class I SAM-dependent methyltransferase [Gammaproteobacteria bacterium]